MKFPTLPTLLELKANYDEYDAIQRILSHQVEMPTKPREPRLSSTSPTDDEIAKYQTDKMQYEVDKTEYLDEMRHHREFQTNLYNLLEEYIKDVSGLNSIPAQYQDKVYSHAWEDGHSDGYYSVYQKLVELIKIFN